MHYCRLFEHRVARWTYLPNYIFGSSIGYAVASILPIDPVASVAIVTTAISSYALRKPIAITLLLLMFFPLNLLLPMLGAAAIGNAFPLPKHNENKINKNRQWGRKLHCLFFITCCFNNASNSSKLCTSYVGIIPLSFNFLSD